MPPKMVALSLEHEQAKQLVRQAGLETLRRERRVTVSGLVREAIAAYLKTLPPMTVGQ